MASVSALLKIFNQVSKGLQLKMLKAGKASQSTSKVLGQKESVGKRFSQVLGRIDHRVALEPAKQGSPDAQKETFVKRFSGAFTNLKNKMTQWGPFKKGNSGKSQTDAADQDPNKANSSKGSFLQNAVHVSTLLLNGLRMYRVIQAIKNGSGQKNSFSDAAKKNEELAQSQDKVNDKLKKGKKESAGMLENFQKQAAAILNLENAQKLFQATVGGAMEQQDQKEMFIKRTGSKQVGTDMFEMLKDEAMKSGTNVKEYLANSLNFMSVTENSDQITKLNKIAQRLAFFDPEKKGLEENGSAIKDALGGDGKAMDSLLERFAISPDKAKSLNFEELTQKGDANGFISALEKLLELNNMGQGVYDKISDVPTEQIATLGDHIKNAFANSGQAALTALMPIVTMINEAFESGKFQPFFDGLSAALYGIASVTATVVQFLLDNWTTVQNVLLILGGVLLVLAAIWLIQWLAGIWPILLIIGIIMLLIDILNQVGVSTSEIVAIVIGVFFGLYTFLRNVFALLWDIIVTFVESAANAFYDPVNAVKTLIYEVAKDVLDFINTIIGDIDSIIVKINKAFGKNISVIGQIDGKWVEDLKPEQGKPKFDLSKYRLEQQSVLDGYNQGKSFAENAMKFVADKGANMKQQFSGWNNMLNKDSPPAKQPGSELPNLNHVNSIGQIDNTVDISSEDLKVMRDLAEIQSIQNFVTLTPTVQVTTGDIHQPTDANEMIRRIEEVMSREIANSAQGVYA
ncbi:hypothetical protein QJ48_26830 [Paenibacillus sp. A3]|uniref:hypothetical protein n=1 Tax=Paenibacillus sp. A3 TaxID=1337054 RepID=UPI0006D53E18|nr:hypothetical protein [Paenibacillus sp. A3]KPV56568.1 hypothetical protein QJ48_26830 [Paenibacillus sp. A3]